jgi:DNA-directed RNA polymerase specialized sigma24 family protein|tara:strand:+ start:7929 stop:8162 length:234 start_codon:yes stop_codon:yes gene_type:complete
MRLENIVDDYSEMSQEERLAKIREIREDRKISKHAVTVRKKREQDKNAKFKKLFEGLSPEEREVFLKQMAEGVDDED